MRGLLETKRCHKERLFSSAACLRHSGHSGLNQNRLHCGPEYRLLAGGSALGRQGENSVIDESSATSVHDHILWSLQCSSDVSTGNGNSLKRRHLWVTSRVLGRRDHDWSHVLKVTAQTTEIVPAVPRRPPKAQSAVVPTISEGNEAPWAYFVTWGNNHRPRETESRTGIADPEE
jgi:hypothetical protein